MSYQDSLHKGRAESFSKFVSQFTLFVSESHGGCCPEKKCLADISIKTNVQLAFFNGMYCLFLLICVILQSKTTSYDPFILECVAFIHQQSLASNHNFLLVSSSAEADDASRHYRDSMMQCRTVCLQSLHQLVHRCSTNIKTAAPDLKLDPDRFMGLGDEDDSRSIYERLFDEYLNPRIFFF
jgi:hypothetical protein